MLNTLELTPPRNVTLQESTEADLEELAHKMREEDKRELLSLKGFTPREAIESLKNTAKGNIHSGYYKGKLAIVFGVMPCDIRKGAAVIWLLGTNQATAGMFSLVRYTPIVLKKLLAGYRYGYNFVDTRNSFSLFWLKSIGAIIHSLSNNGAWEIRYYPEKKSRPDIKQIDFDVNIVGASSYIGQNLLQHLTTLRVATIDRRPVTSSTQQIDLSLPLSSGTHPAMTIKSRKLIICGYPVAADFAMNETYYTNLRYLVLNACNTEELEEIHFLSTAEVYEYENDDFNGNDSSPHNSYELYKLQFELFLKYIHNSIRRDIKVTIYRLPLVIGGNPTNSSSQHKVHQLYMSHTAGLQFAENNDSYNIKHGTSWVYLPDLLPLLCSKKADRKKNRRKPIGEGRYKVKSPASGYTDYIEFQRIFSKVSPRKRTATYAQPKMSLKIKDTDNLPGRCIESVVTTFIKELELE